MIGERLAKLRKARKVTQDELGDYLSLTKYSISMYENNKNTPPEEAAIKLAKYFDVSLDYLLGLTDEPYSYQRESAYVIRVSMSVPVLVREVISDYVEFVNQKFMIQDEKEF